jgi:hypothetical protein
VTGGVVLVTRDDGPDHPSAWDPTVTELVSFVEDEKGASFEHPVSVVVLDEAQFKERLSVDDETTRCSVPTSSTSCSPASSNPRTPSTP